MSLRDPRGINYAEGDLGVTGHAALTNVGTPDDGVLIVGQEKLGVDRRVLAPRPQVGEDKAAGSRLRIGDASTPPRTTPWPRVASLVC